MPTCTNRFKRIYRTRHRGGGTLNIISVVKGAMEARRFVLRYNWDVRIPHLSG